jgi:hypothetical protein
MTAASAAAASTAAAVTSSVEVLASRASVDDEAVCHEDEGGCRSGVLDVITSASSSTFWV